jgi:hypothetical protein
MKLPPVCCVKWLNKQTERSPNHRAITNHLNLDECQPFLPTFSGLKGISYFSLESCMVCKVHRERNGILMHHEQFKT